MKRICMMVSAALVMAGMTGCQSLNQSAATAPHGAVMHSVFEPKVAIGEKVSGTSEGFRLFGLFWIGPNKFADGVTYNMSNSSLLNWDKIAKVKAAAAYEAVNRSSADILIGPQYVIEQENFIIIQRIKATVTGYKGTIESVSQK